MNWLRTVLYGFLSGLAEFLPVSSQAHQSLAGAVFGLPESAPLRQFLIRAACLAALWLTCSRDIAKLQRDVKLAKVPPRRRSRPVDTRSTATARLLIAAVIPMLIGMLFYQRAQQWINTLPALCVTLLINGVLLFIPQYTRSGNKDGRMLSRMDGMLLGLSGALSVFPGISRMSSLHFAGSMRGADRGYTIQFALLLSIPALIVMLIYDVIAVFGGIETLSFLTLLTYLLSMISAYWGSKLAISMVRSLAVKSGFSGFAYYCWGMALVCLILYLTT